MQIWVNALGNITVNFQAESDEERIALDKLLGYNGCIKKPVGNDPFTEIGKGAQQVAHLGGHEYQRWIIIDLTMALRHPGR